MLKDKKIGIIGAGQMSEAIFSGILKSNGFTPENITVTDINKDRLEFISGKYNINTVPNQLNEGINKIVDMCDIIIVAIKPQFAENILLPIKGLIRQDQIVISIMGGVTINKLETLIGDVQLVRAMPNTPAFVCEGITGICNNSLITKENLALAVMLFETIGVVYQLEEKLIDPLTSVSGCGPAFAYMFIDAIADAGVELGLPRATSIALASQMLLGSAKMVLETNTHPAQLKDNVCSPAGGTIAGVHSLENGGFRGIVTTAVQASCERMAEVGKKA